MKIAFFSNQFASASGHGIAHYAHQLYEGLSHYQDLHILPVATGCDRSPTQKQELREKTGLKLLPWGRKLTPLAWTFLNSPPIERWFAESIDVTHIVSLGFPVATNRKLVVTVHDIGPLTHPEYFAETRPWLFKRSFEHMVRYADAIICVSKTTADEVIDYTGPHIAGRLQVIHEGVDTTWFSQTPIDPYAAVSNLPPPGVPFFMAAGAISPRKNIQRVLDAFAQLIDTVPHHLVLVGGKGWDANTVFTKINHPKLASRVHHLGYVSDTQLQALYKHASFYISPSLFEGFGLNDPRSHGCRMSCHYLQCLISTRSSG